MEKRKIHLECTGKRFENITRQKRERIQVLVYELSSAVPESLGEVWLTLTEAKMLLVLGLRIDEVVRISSFERNISQDSVRVHLCRINKKFDAIGLGKPIVSTKRFEYCLTVSGCNFYPLFISAFESIHPDDQQLLCDHVATPLALLTGLCNERQCPQCGCNLR